MHGYAAVEYIDMWDGDTGTDGEGPAHQLTEAETEPDLPPSIVEVPIPTGLKHLLQWFPIPGVDKDFKKAKKAAKDGHVWEYDADEIQKEFAERAVELRPRPIVQVRYSVATSTIYYM